jgi:hypothetical protein
MEGILKFNLPEEADDFDSAVNGYKFKLILWDMDQHLRSIAKYSEDDNKATIAQELRDKLHEYFSEYNVSIS